MCLISSISCWRATRLSRQDEEWKVNSSPFRSIHSCLSEFSRIMAAKTLKIRIAHRQWCSNFPRGKKTKIRKERPKFTYSVALVIVSLAAESENRQMEDFPQAYFGCVSESFLQSVGKKSISNCKFCYWKLRALLVFVVIQRIFHLEPQRHRTLWFLLGDCRSSYFHSSIKSTLNITIWTWLQQP